MPPSGIVYLGQEESGNNYPGYRGSEGKAMFEWVERLPKKNHISKSSNSSSKA